MPYSILKQDALENIWCQPQQDFQHIFRPQRLSAAGGAFKVMPILMGSVKLPNYDTNGNYDRYHVYQIGFQWKTTYLIEITYGTWVRSDILMEQSRVLIDTYFENGCMIPRTDVYVQFTSDSNMLVAIRLNYTVDVGTETITEEPLGTVVNRAVTLENSKPIIRFYAASYYRSEAWRNVTKNPIYPVRVVSSKVTSASEFANWLSRVNSIEAAFGSEGASTFWVDGFLESKPTAWAVKYKDKVLTMVRESAIKSISFISGAGIPTFLSTLDKNYRKYILLSPTNYGVIDFFDDLDVYIVKKTATTYKGVLVTRFKSTTVRQITHNCYSIDATVVRTIIDSHPTLFADLDDVHFMLIARDSGNAPGLNHQANRIEELYRLDRAGILEAMSGVNSLVPEWRADALEASDYCKVMRSTVKEITETLVETAYGYNAAAAVGEPMFHYTENVSGQYQLNVPPTFLLTDSTNSTNRSYFVYDQNGLLIDYYQQDNTASRIVLDQSKGIPARVETIHGQLSESLDGCYYDNIVESVDLTYWGYRCYTCSLNNGTPNEIWVDVTGDLFYEFEAVGPNGLPRIVWNQSVLDSYGLYPCVKIGKYTHVFTKTFDSSKWQGVLYATVLSNVVFQGESQTKAQRLEPGSVDVWVDGYNLIEGLDYIIKWPNIYICRRMANPLDYTQSTITVRTRGWCEPDTGKHRPPREVGWVSDNKLSLNGTYDPRRDRNIRLVVDGQLTGTDAVVWSEDAGTTEFVSAAVDGRAYAVTDVYTVVEPWTGQTTVEYRAASYAVDNRVSAYLTPRLAEPTEVLPTVNGQRWGLYSPFLSAILFAMTANEWLKNGELSVQWDNNNVAEWIAPYKYLLDYDPCLLDHDENYVWIYPHPHYDAMGVSAEQYRLLEYLVKNYLRSKIDLTPSVMVV